MEARGRPAWTDERLDDMSNRMDDMSNRMDAGFSRIDADIRLIHGRIDSLGDTLNGRIDSLHRMLILGMVAILASGVGTMLTTILTRA